MMPLWSMGLCCLYNTLCYLIVAYSGIYEGKLTKICIFSHCFSFRGSFSSPLLFSSLCVINLSKHQVTGTPRTWVRLLSHFLFSCMQKLRHRDHDDADAMGMLGWVLTVESQPWRRCSWVFKEIVLWHQFVKIGSREQKKKKKKKKKKERKRSGNWELFAGKFCHK